MAVTRAPGASRRLLPVWLVLSWLLPFCVVAFADAAGTASAVPATVASAAPATGSALDGYLAKLAPDELFPGADRFGPAAGSPPIAPVFRGGERVGAAFLTADFVDTRGYSGKPIYVVAALDEEGTIRGVRIVEHSEPILMVGVPEHRIAESVRGYVGFNAIRASAEGRGPPEPDIVSGATVTVLIIGDSIVRSAARVIRILRAHAAAAPGTTAGRVVVDNAAGSPGDWAGLLEQGAIGHLRLTAGDVHQAFVEAGETDAASLTRTGTPEAEFIDLYVALASQPAIGRTLLGEDEYERVRKWLGPDRQALLIAASGSYSFKGSAWFRGGIFDRIELVQGLETIRFWKRHHRRIGRLLAPGAADVREIGVFAIPSDAEFDPVAPWRLQLIVQQQINTFDHAFARFSLPYRLPSAYTTRTTANGTMAVPGEPVSGAAAPMATGAAPDGHAGRVSAAGPPVESVAGAAAPLQSAGSASPELAAEADFAADPAPLWQRIWKSRIAAIIVLALMLLALTVIFFFQNLIVPHEKLFDRIRLTYLTVTLLWLGWVAQAQLSVVNVLTFVDSLRTGFHWESFLVDPLIFILWCSVAAALLFWGRGPFCGWLCPFGALQELTNRIARRLKVPQLKIPWGVHERLWPFKYIIFLGLFGISLGSLAWAERFAEIEPFKTAIVLRFMREWWFVAFALALLGAGLFIERFFCRYLCPLGAALAIPGRMRMFDWLKRYRECGNPCMRCFKECPVEAIHPEGHINPNECISCLHCQVLYHHDHKCPVRVQRRLKREKRAAMARPASAPAADTFPVTVHRRPRGTV